jgi:hypothetical protein
MSGSGSLYHGGGGGALHGKHADLGKLRGLRGSPGADAAVLAHEFGELRRLSRADHHLVAVGEEPAGERRADDT